MRWKSANREKRRSFAFIQRRDFKKLFAYISTDANDKADCADKVILRSAKNRNDEILRVAVDVAKGVREGKRYKDFEVFVSDLDAYAQDIKPFFQI